MTALDFGLVLRVTARGGTLMEMAAMNDRILAACAAHDLSAWVVDHLQFDDIPLMECLALLAHSAGRAPGVRFGTLVLGQGYRNPALTAKIAATLQFLTGGRFVLGIGAGWKEDKYRAYGYPTRPRPSGSPSSTRRSKSSARCGRRPPPPSPARTMRWPRHTASPGPIPSPS